MEVPAAIPFSALARLLAAEARRNGLSAPSFLTPPRVPGANRTIRRLRGGGVMVAVRVRDRSLDAVLDDMIEGVVRANGLTGTSADGWRLALRSVIAPEEARAA